MKCKRGGVVHANTAKSVATPLPHTNGIKQRSLHTLQLQRSDTTHCNPTQHCRDPTPQKCPTQSHTHSQSQSQSQSHSLTHTHTLTHSHPSQHKHTYTRRDFLVTEKNMQNHNRLHQSTPCDLLHLHIYSSLFSSSLLLFHSTHRCATRALSWKWSGKTTHPDGFFTAYKYGSSIITVCAWRESVCVCVCEHCGVERGFFSFSQSTQRPPTVSVRRGERGRRRKRRRRKKRSLFHNPQHTNKQASIQQTTNNTPTQSLFFWCRARDVRGVAGFWCDCP